MLKKLSQRSWLFLAGFFLMPFFIFCTTKDVKKDQEYQRSVELTKKIIIENWINSFYEVLSPASIESIFTNEKILDLSKNFVNEDLIEIFYQLNRADFSNIFKRHNDLLQVLEPGINNFFASIYDFLTIFPNLKAKYYSDRNLTLYLKENFLSLEKTSTELGKLWNHIFNLAHILIDIEINNVESDSLFQLLKKKNSNGTFQRNLRVLTNYSSGLKNQKFFNDVILEYEGVHKILSDMLKDEWITSDKNWLKKFLSKSFLNKNINVEHLAKAKIKAALKMIEVNKNMAIKDKNTLDKKLQSWKKSLFKQDEGLWKKISAA